MWVSTLCPSSLPWRSSNKFYFEVGWKTEKTWKAHNSGPRPSQKGLKTLSGVIFYALSDGKGPEAKGKQETRVTRLTSWENEGKCRENKAKNAWKHKNGHSSGSRPSQKEFMQRKCRKFCARSHGPSPRVMRKKTRKRTQTRTRTRIRTRGSEGAVCSLVNKRTRTEP